MRNCGGFFYFLGIVVVAVAMTIFYEKLREEDRKRWVEKQAEAWYYGKQAGVNERDRFWKETLLPPMLDDAYYRGAEHQDSIWRSRLPKIIAIADSLGYARGQADAEAFFRQVVSDTVLALKNQVWATSQACRQAGCHHGTGKKTEEVAGQAPASLSPSSLSWLHRSLAEKRTRLAWGTLVFGASFLLIRWLARGPGKAAVRFKRRRRW